MFARWYHHYNVQQQIPYLEEIVDDRLEEEKVVRGIPQYQVDPEGVSGVAVFQTVLAVQPVVPFPWRQGWYVGEEIYEYSSNYLVVLILNT